MTTDTPSAEALAAAVQKIREALAVGPTDGPWEFGSYAGGEIRIGVAGKSKHGAFAVMTGRAAVPWDQSQESREAFNDAAFISACDPATIRTILAALDAAQAPREVPKLSQADIEEIVLRVPYEGDTTTPWRAEWTEQIGAPLIRAVEARVRELCGVAL